MRRPGIELAFMFMLCAACGSTSSDGAGGGGTGAAAGVGGTAGTAGTAGAGTGGGADCAALCGAPGCPACSGPPMISDTSPEGKFRIDATEVTNAQYQAFLAAGVDPASQPAECSWNSELAPNTTTPSSECTTALFDPVNRADYPVVCVDWCDAQAYCKWAGKRLCQHPGGPTLGGDVSFEWIYACTANQTLTFPYGNTYDPSACNGKDSGNSELAAGRLPGLL